MSQITEHFSLAEFACPDYGVPTEPKHLERLARLCAQLEVVREELGGAPITIISGYRSPSYNERIGGATKSQHMNACAADIKVKGVSPRDVHTAILRLIKEGKVEEGGLGLYETFVHFDVRGHRARWYGSNVSP
jgi:uncharacterized protein YcbK (DUF882 family)